MKKLLLASTALVAFAGAAAAEVTVSGSAEMGIVGGDGVGVNTEFWQDVDVAFALRGTTDSGLEFGANISLEDTDTATGDFDTETDDFGTTVFIKGSFGTLTLGDTDGALDWALTEAGNMGNPGSINDAETGHAGYQGSYLDGDNAGDGQILRYDNTFGAIGVAVSVEQGANGAEDTGYAVGVKYSADLGGTTLGLGLGYQQAAGNLGLDNWGVSVTAGFGGGIVAGIVYSDGDFSAANQNTSHLGVGVGYESGPIAVHANYGEYDGGASGFGLAGKYDLGGGAALHAGFGDSDGANNSVWSLGVSMSF